MAAAMLDGNRAALSRRAASVVAPRALQPSAFRGREVDHASLVRVYRDDARDVPVGALPPDATELHPPSSM